MLMNEKEIHRVLEQKHKNKVDCYTLPLGRAPKQSDIRKKCDNKNQPNVHYSYKRELLVNRKDLQASILVSKTGRTQYQTL